MHHRPAPLALALSLLVAGAAHAGEHRSDPAEADGQPATAAQVKQLQAVTVSAALDVARNALSPDTGASQYRFDRASIEALPLGSATPLDRVLLQAPGVVQDARGGIHVRGDHDNLQYRINGVMLPEMAGGFGQSLDAHMVADMKLLAGALPAQYGLRTSAVVDITTRSGHALGQGGSLGVTGGSFGTLNPHAAWWGSAGRWDWFFSGSYLHTDAGIENPAASRKPIHDRSNQFRGLGNLSYVLGEHSRVSLLFGAADNRYQIPNRPGQVPSYAYLDRTEFDSALLDANQDEENRFAVLSVQGQLAGSDYQFSLGRRDGNTRYRPDVTGELMFNGVASTVDDDSRASTVQLDVATPLGDRHTLRYGVYGSVERVDRRNDAWVFPADADGTPTSTVPIRILDDGRLTAHTWSAYVQDEWSLGEDWTLNYGLRGDVFRMARHESQLSPRLGVVWQAGPDTVVHAGYARYFTPPATALISSSDIARFDGTTNAVVDSGHNLPLAQRADYYDLGISQQIGDAWTLGLDAYVSRLSRLQDEGQFGAAMVYSTFNFAQGRVKGLEFTANYERGPLSAWFNAALSRAQGKRILSSQYNFEPEDLAWIAEHWTLLDHDQRLSSSGGFSYQLDPATRVGATCIYGSGLRKDGTVPNGASLPSYVQLDLSLGHDFRAGDFGQWHAQLAVINALDRSYLLRDGSGIGVGAPQYASRRGVYLGLSAEF